MWIYVTILSFKNILQESYTLNFIVVFIYIIVFIETLENQYFIYIIGLSKFLVVYNNVPILKCSAVGFKLLRGIYFSVCTVISVNIRFLED